MAIYCGNQVPFDPWLDGNPPVFYVGVNYDPDKRGIDDPLVEPA